MADADGQAAWDDDVAPPSRRRGRLVAAVALGLAALLLLGAFVASRSGPDGDILALGPATDANDLPPVDDTELLTDGAGPGGQSQLTPGDSIPGVAAGGDPAAVAAGGGAAGAATAGAGGGGATRDGVTGGVTGPLGPGPGQGIPTPTTRPGTPTTAGPGTTQPPPPPPCAITNVSVSPNPVNRNARGSDKNLLADVRVTFRPTNCGSSEFRVRIDGLLEVGSAPTNDGYLATISASAVRWEKRDYTVIVAGGGAQASAILSVQN